LRQVRDKLQVELSPRLADILDLPRLASSVQIAARVAALDHKPPPRRPDTCELLAAVALLGEDLIDNYRGVGSDLELLPACAAEVGGALLEQLGTPQTTHRISIELLAPARQAQPSAVQPVRVSTSRASVEASCSRTTKCSAMECRRTRSSPRRRGSSWLLHKGGVSGGFKTMSAWLRTSCRVIVSRCCCCRRI